MTLRPLLSTMARLRHSLPSLIAAAALAACETEVVKTPRPPEIVSPTPQIEAMKHDVVQRLAQCESGDQSIYSPGGVYVGVLQFNRGTVVAYYRMLYGLQITTKDAVEIAMDRDRAYQLAKDIIFTTDSKVRDWPACSRKLGLAAEVDRIRAMEKS